MNLVLLGRNSAGVIESRLKSSLDNYKIQTYETFGKFVTASDARTMAIDRIIVLQDIFPNPANDAEINELLGSFSDYLCKWHVSVRVITLSTNDRLAKTFAKYFTTASSVNILASNTKMTLLLDIASESLEVLSNKYTCVRPDFTGLVSMEISDDVSSKTEATISGAKTKGGFLGGLFGGGRGKTKSHGCKPETKVLPGGVSQATPQGEVETTANVVFDNASSTDLTWGNNDVLMEEDGTVNSSDSFDEAAYSLDTPDETASAFEPEASVSSDTEFVKSTSNSGVLELREVQDDEINFDWHTTDGEYVTSTQQELTPDETPEDIVAQAKQRVAAMNIVDVKSGVDVPNLQLRSVKGDGSVIDDAIMQQADSAFEQFRQNEMRTRVVSVNKGRRGGVRFIIVTGDRKSGVTRTALRIAGLYGKAMSTLYVDFDSERRGSLAYLGLESLLDVSQTIRCGLAIYDEKVDLLPLVYSVKDFHCLISMYDREVTAARLKMIQLLLTNQTYFDTVVIDCPMYNIEILEDCVVGADVLICTGSSKPSVISLLLEMYRYLGDNTRLKTLVYRASHYILVGSEDIRELQSNIHYAAGVFEMDEDPWNWGVRPVIGTYKTLNTAIQKL